MATTPQYLGPWAGIDNVHNAGAKVFQVPGELEKRVPMLVQASNVDLDDDGWVTSRQPVSTITNFSAGLGGWVVGGRLFCQDGGILYEGNTKDTPLITGLVGRVSLYEYWGKIFVTDGSRHYEIEGDVVRAWGLPVPQVTLAPASGSLSPGTYLVQVAFVDARGNEGGVSTLVSATLASATGILVSVSNQSIECVGANIYISGTGQKITSYLTTVALGKLPYIVQGDDVTTTDPPKTLQMTGPISNAAGIFSFRAFMLMWRDGVVFRSEATEPHLFHADNIMQFGGDVTACEAVKDGMWVGTTKGLIWVEGSESEGWIPVTKAFDAVLRGSTRLQGEKVPKLRTNELIALFVTASGLVAGLPGGQMVPLTDNTYIFDAMLRASIAYVERDNLRQIVVGLGV